MDIVHQSRLPTRYRKMNYRRRYYGRSRFLWNEYTLGIVIRGIFQFHHSGQRLSLVQIAPHIRDIVCQYVKAQICGGAVGRGMSDVQYDKMCARWVRRPSLRAVTLKLQECSAFMYLVGSTEASYESLHDDGFMPPMFYRAMNDYLSQTTSYFHRSRSTYVVPAIPIHSLDPAWGYCFDCGRGLTDKIDLNFVPRCNWPASDESADNSGCAYVCLCSLCNFSA